MTTVYGMMVTKNEEARWLSEVLAHSKKVVDRMFVFDDRSTDRTPEICAQHGAITVIRDPQEPSFTDNEGRFRQCAWNHFREQCQPDEDDWVFTLDADEFPVSLAGTPGMAARAEIRKAIQQDAGSIVIDFKEIWNLDPLQYRMDGFWDTIRHPRLFAYRDQDEWNPKLLGGGSCPDYVKDLPVAVSEDLVILHYGYARDEDKAAKWDRYSKLAGSHSNRHIQSIITKPILVDWTGSRP